MKKLRLFGRLSGWFLMAAMFLGFGSGTLRAQDDVYDLVTDASKLKDGDEVLIVGVYSASSIYAMTASEATSTSGAVSRQTVKVVPVDNKLTNPDIATTGGEKKACVFTLVKNEAGKYAFRDVVNNNYLHEMTTLELTSSPTPSYFSIDIDENNAASISDGTYQICLNMSTSFKGVTPAKAGTSWYYLVYLYKKEDLSIPYIRTNKTEVSYRIDPNANLDENLFFKAGNLEDDVTVTVESANEGQAAVISVSPEEISVADAASFDLALTTKNLPLGMYSDIITLTSGDVEVKVTVNLVVKEPDVYKLVTNVAKLKDGDEVLIVGEGDYAMTASGANQYGSRPGVQVTIADNAITNPDIATAADEKKACVFTLEKDAAGNYAFNDNLNPYKYLSGPNSSYGSNSGSSTTPVYFSVTLDDAGTGAAAVNITDDTRLLRYYHSTTYDEFRFTTSTSSSYKDIYFYKKQVPTCEEVTLPEDGATTTTETSVEIIWDDPEEGQEPANGYRVSVTGPGYNQTQTTSQTQIEFTGLSAGTGYSFEIVSVCGVGFESDPVTGTFITDFAGNPELDIDAPDNNTTFSGDITFTFHTTDFDLDDTHLVKVEVKAKKQTTAGQAAAPVLKRLYTQASPVTIPISGLADGEYHVDLYMVLVNGKDTSVIGFDPDAANPQYVHRDIKVKHPAVYFSPNPLKITTYRGESASGEVTVTGWALPTGSSVSFSSNSANFTVTPSSLTQAQVMAEGGAKITVAYNGTAANATATITATCGAITSTLTVNGMARDTLANLKGLYSRANNDTVLVRGKMVVTHKDTANNRVWVQDINKENGASMLLYQVTVAKGFSDLKVGDVLGNFAGRVTIFEGLRRFTPLAKVTASEHNHAVYVDTLTADDINNNFATVQSALACVKDVTFNQTGNFVKNTKYTLKQGNKTVNFVAFNSADYVGKPIPTVRLYVVGVLTKNTTYGNYIASRKEADMTEAPCLVPTDFNAEVRSDEATMEWTGSAANYSVRYAKTEAGLASAEAKTVTGSSFTATELDALTTYYYQVKSLCSATAESGWSAVQSFTTRSAEEPAVNMVTPVGRPTFTDSVKVSFRLKNVTLAAGDITARIVFSDGFTVEGYTDTVYKRAMPSGDYSVQVILTKGGQALEPSVQTLVRYFSVDLPDVEKPTFAPKAGRYKDSVEVTLNCTTPGASIFYAKGEGEYVAYAAGSKILLKESAVLKAFACKERMDTSEVATAAYTVYSLLSPEGDLVFAENFNKSDKASTTVISNFGEFTDMSGWTGANMYPEVGEIKGGTSTKAGRLVSREINLAYDNGKYYVAFFARAYNNKADSTKIRLTAGGETVLVNDLDKTAMFEYVYLFNNGAANTQLTFEALAASYNRFYLDSIRVYQKLPEIPMIIAPATLSMATVLEKPISQTITVRGKLLAEDITVSCPSGNFTVSPATLDKEAVMSDEGAELIVTFNGSVDFDEVGISLAGSGLTQTIMVTATAKEPEPCDAPSNLMATVAERNVSLSWEGEAAQYRVVVRLGQNEVCNETLEAKSYELTDLEAGTYSWSVVSVCENGEQAAEGEDFIVVAQGDECGAPTLLSAAVVDNNVTLSWNGETETFRVMVRKGEDTVCYAWIPETLYELENLEAGIYTWKVAAICPKGQQWAAGEDFEVMEPLSANEGAEGLAFRIYPNPTVGAFYVEVAESARMEIFTVGGVMIRNAELTEGKHEIRLDRSGIYFVRLTNASGAAVNRVIVR